MKLSNKRGDIPQKKYYSLLQSISFAVQGICFAITHERNLRIHLLIATYLLYVGFWYYHLTVPETVVLLLTMSLVIITEMVNTAIEKIVDFISPDYNIFAKIAKDVAAGAVLLASICSIVIGMILFAQGDIIIRVIGDILHYRFIYVPLGILAILFVVLPEKTQKPIELGE